MPVNLTVDPRVTKHTKKFRWEEKERKGTKQRTDETYFLDCSRRIETKVSFHTCNKSIYSQIENKAHVAIQQNRKKTNNKESKIQPNTKKIHMTKLTIRYTRGKQQRAEGDLNNRTSYELGDASTGDDFKAVTT